ncbi:MAG TPA: hypothetical protein VG890_18430, partial [Puia sp.]|nr:hypothetical protein [Puia sp.]
RPMRRYFGGRWVSLMGIPPLTIIFLVVMIPYTLIRHRFEVLRRQRKFAGKAVGKAWTNAWF